MRLMHCKGANVFWVSCLAPLLCMLLRSQSSPWILSDDSTVAQKLTIYYHARKYVTTRPDKLPHSIFKTLCKIIIIKVIKNKIPLYTTNDLTSWTSSREWGTLKVSTVKCVLFSITFLIKLHYKILDIKMCKFKSC